MRARFAFPVSRATVAAIGLTCAAFAATASAQDTPSVTHVVCVTSETGEAHTVWINETPEAAGPRAGFGAAADGSTYCYRRIATPGSQTSVALSGTLQSTVTIRTAADFQTMAAEMRALSELPSACEMPPTLIAEADVEQRRAVLLRIFKDEGATVCATSVGAPPPGASGLEAFETTRAGGQPVYYESAERKSFPLCIVNQSSRQIAAWPRVRPDLPEDFVPREHVTRAGSETPWCSRYWLPTGSTISVALGDIRARHEPNSPDFTDACVIGDDLIESARAGARAGVVVRVTRQRGQLRCVAGVEPAPARALGLNAFNPPQQAAEH